MRWIARRAFIVVATAGVATAALAQAPAKRPPQIAVEADPAKEAEARAALEKLLVLWEKQSVRIKTLDVGFTRVDKSPGWDRQDEFQGRASFSAPNLVCVHYQKVVPAQQANPAQLKDHLRIVCTGKELLQYNYEKKQIRRLALDKDFSKQLLAGITLPFFFKFNLAEAKQNYDIKLLREMDDALLISFVPKPNANAPKLFLGGNLFSKMFVQLNRTTMLPDRVFLVLPNGKDTQDYVFSGLRANAPINDQFFHASLTQGWRVF